MNGLKYQLKSIRRDKMCILTFLLPIIVGIGINLISGVSFQTMSETSFGVLKDHVSDEVSAWLQKNGSVTPYEELDALKEAVNDPATQMIGVMETEQGIKTFVAGDELEVNKTIADTLPGLYDSRNGTVIYEKNIVPVMTDQDGLKSLFIVITLVTAMFMGCTFNAMNIISEKEEGIALINQILPMTAKTYLLQKLLLGFAGGTVSTVVTAFICFRIGMEEVLPFLLLVILSAYIAAVVGLFIGRFSEGLMVGIVYIKMIMILFLAPPYIFLFDSSRKQYVIPLVISVAIQCNFLWVDGFAERTE